MSPPEKNTISIVIPTLGRKSLRDAKDSCGEIPVEVEKDPHKTGAGPARNRAIQRVKTDWVGFLDDDDRLADPVLYQSEVLEQDAQGTDCVVFRAQFPDGRILPKVPEVIWSNVTIAFCARTSLLRKYPFVKGDNRFQQNEDYLVLKTLEENGAKIVFSPHVAYLVKPSAESQQNARINNK